MPGPQRGPRTGGSEQSGQRGERRDRREGGRGGQAAEKGAKFLIQRETYPDFVSANILAIKDYAQLEVGGKPLILIKPLGQQKHGGGTVLKEDSEEYKILTKFVTDIESGDTKTCDDNGALQVGLISSQETIRKAAILLAGRYPTEQELASAAAGDLAMSLTIQQMTREEKFYDFLRETWNDSMLTDRGVARHSAQLRRRRFWRRRSPPRRPA